jgi:hypothetical protein
MQWREPLTRRHRARHEGLNLIVITGIRKSARQRCSTQVRSLTRIIHYFVSWSTQVLCHRLFVADLTQTATQFTLDRTNGLVSGSDS